MARRSSIPARAKVPEVFRLLKVFETQFDYVYRTLRRYGFNATDAEDLSQEVFLVLWRRRESFDPGRPIRPWIAGITYRIVQEHRRTRAREVLADEVDAPDGAPTPDEQLVSAHARRLVLRALAGVPEKQRVVLVMHDLDGIAMREIADTLALPLFTTYSQLRAGRRAFAREVRRAQLVSSLAVDLRRAKPRALLASERVVLPAPRRARERAMSRLKGVAAGAGLEQAWPPTDSRPLGGTEGLRRSVVRELRWLGGGFVGAAALLGLVMSWGYAPDSAEALPAGSPEVSARAAGAAFPRPLARALTGPELARGPGYYNNRLRAVPRIALSTQQLTLERRPGPPSLLRGLIGYWRFDEQPGSNLARDISGGANHCLLQKLDTQGVWGEGALSGSLKLDGRGWLECRNTERLVRIEGELTIAAWVTRGRLVRNYHVVMARQKDSGRRDEFFFGFANGDLAFVSHVLGVKIIRPLPPDLPHWFHIAIARHDDGTSLLFVNGVEVGRSPGAWARLAGGDNPIIIGGGINGRNQTKTESRFDGAVDELVLYHRALSAEEIKLLATKRQPPAPSDEAARASPVSLSQHP